MCWLSDTLHTEGVSEDRATGKPDDAVAVIEIGGDDMRAISGVVTLMVCIPREIVKERSIGTAAANVALPDCVARTVQRPTLRSWMVVPPTKHDCGVRLWNATGRPELAAALTLAARALMD